MQKTSRSEKLQQELVVVTRVPQRVDFKVWNNCSLWETRKDGKPFSSCAWSKRDSFWHFAQKAAPASGWVDFRICMMRPNVMITIFSAQHNWQPKFCNVWFVSHNEI